MSQTLVVDDTRSVVAVVVVDDLTGSAIAICETCGWVTDPERGYSFEDVVQEAHVHVDREHA